MIGHSACVLLALATMAHASDKEVASLARGQLGLGQQFEIETSDCVYRGHLVDRVSGQCWLATSSDGANFTSPRTIFLLGATAGRQAPQMLVLMREVKVGLKMELGIGDLEEKNRLLTSEVTSIRLSH